MYNWWGFCVSANTLIMESKTTTILSRCNLTALTSVANSISLTVFFFHHLRSSLCWEGILAFFHQQLKLNSCSKITFHNDQLFLLEIFVSLFILMDWCYRLRIRFPSNKQGIRGPGWSRCRAASYCGSYRVGGSWRHWAGPPILSELPGEAGWLVRSHQAGAKAAPGMEVL